MPVYLKVIGSVIWCYLVLLQGFLLYFLKKTTQK